MPIAARFRACCSLLSLCVCCIATELDAGEDFAFFEKRIRPVLVRRCYKCHSVEAGKRKGGLLLDSREAIRRGGDSGAAITPENVEDSLLIQAIRYESYEMPPDGRLPDRVIDDFVHWIEGGAVDPRDNEVLPMTKPPHQPSPLWSVDRPALPPVPSVSDPSWPRSPIDHFVLSRLEKLSMTPAEDASLPLLCRRLHLTLVGLPPTPGQLQSFLAAAERSGSSAATAQLVDSLLSSPGFGERWGRHWLDVARYADTNIGSSQRPWTNAWLYRNYVIKRFNDGTPFDRFVHEQIAGDMLPAATDQQRADQLVATGFLGLATRDLTERDAFQIQLDGIDDALETIGKSMLGLSIGCARCHDHKFDPIPSSDYYAMAGILRSSWLTGIRSRTATFNGDEFVKFHPTTPKTKLPGSRLRATVVTEYRKDSEHDHVGDMAVHLGGSYRRLATVVPRGFIKSLDVTDVDPIPRNESGRVQLAQWLTSRQNPLTARVMANRIWYWLMGRPLVESMDNFGTTGREPTDPELLDWLSLRFRDHYAWQVKPLIREIVLSRTWQMSSDASPANSKSDPENRFYSHMNRVRLEAEQIHDSLLALSGDLDRRFVEQTLPEFGQDNTTNTSSVPIAAEIRRLRAVYLPIFRKDMPTDLDVLKLFNLPDPKYSRGKREANTLPAQALFLWNSPQTHRAAERIVEQLMADGALSETGRAEQLVRLIYAKAPSSRVVRRLIEMKNQYQAAYEQLGAEVPMWKAWKRVVHTMLISNEFIFVG